MSARGPQRLDQREILRRCPAICEERFEPCVVRLAIIGVDEKFPRQGTCTAGIVRDRGSRAGIGRFHQPADAEPFADARRGRGFVGQI